ncbi:serine/threonine protein kinase, partial [Reticulomyxa filosa]
HFAFIKDSLQTKKKKKMNLYVKLENLLVDNNGTLKITDFGLSGLYTREGKMFRTTLGSPNYVAPEVLNGRGYDGFKADIWSCGVILYALLAGCSVVVVVVVIVKICTADFQYPETFGGNVIGNGLYFYIVSLFYLLNSIFQIDPEKRATIEQIKQHPWFKGSELNEQSSREEALMLSPEEEAQVESAIETIEKHTPHSHKNVSFEDSCGQKLVDQLKHDPTGDDDSDNETVVTVTPTLSAKPTKSYGHNKRPSQVLEIRLDEDEKSNEQQQQHHHHQSMLNEVKEEEVFPKRNSLRVQISEVEDISGMTQRHLGTEHETIREISPLQDDSSSRTASPSPRMQAQPIPFKWTSYIFLDTLKSKTSQFTTKHNTKIISELFFL